MPGGLTRVSIAGAAPPQVTLLLRDPYLCKDINELHCNTRYLKVRYHACGPAQPAGPLRGPCLPACLPKCG